MVKRKISPDNDPNIGKRVLRRIGDQIESWPERHWLTELLINHDSCVKARLQNIKRARWLEKHITYTTVCCAPFGDDRRVKVWKHCIDKSCECNDATFQPPILDNQY